MSQLAVPTHFPSVIVRSPSSGGCVELPGFWHFCFVCFSVGICLLACFLRESSLFQIEQAFHPALKLRTAVRNCHLLTIGRAQRTGGESTGFKGKILIFYLYFRKKRYSQMERFIFWLVILSANRVNLLFSKF